MADAKAEQIADAMRTLLAAITGDSGTTYWYTPSAVVRAPGLTSECLDTSKGSPSTIYVLSPGEEEHERATLGGTSGSYFADARIDLSLCQHFTPGTENPHNSPPDPSRWEIQNRMAQDVLKRLYTDTTLGGLALNLAVTTVHREAEETFDPQWAMTFMRVRVFYQYAASAP